MQMIADFILDNASMSGYGVDENYHDVIRTIIHEEVNNVISALTPYLGAISDNTRETADKDLTIGDREIARANKRGMKDMGWTIMD